MTNNESVRFSRDGDQFHYWWAARRCLRLLSPTEKLVAVTIEGPSLSETPSGMGVEAGEEKIDVAEYYGSEDVTEAEQIKYIQLKHSTQKIDVPWQPSELKDTIQAFGERLRELEKQHGTGAFGGRLEFCFISNRPIHQHFREAVEDAAKGAAIRHQQDYNKLKDFTSFAESELRKFCGMLRLEGEHPNYQAQRSSLFSELSGYLPGADIDAPVQLKELVTRKATSEFATNPAIRNPDVLQALKTDESRLFPAPRRIDISTNIVPRAQETDLFKEIVRAGTNPVIIHAAGGVGKTIFSMHIEAGLPHGSLCIVYDCFGNGQYRQRTMQRHRHREALVQISNEMASHGLCDPLVPTDADSAAYLRAFLHRLRQTIASLRQKQSQALLCIVVDAADNAQMAAQEFGEARSFAIDLLRESMPSDVRLVMLCRTHRRNLLNPPPHALHFELQPFTREETAAHLRSVFPEATEHNVIEFHRLSSQNPRVQAAALAQKSTLPEILLRLGPNPTTADDAIDRQLDKAIEDLRDRVTPTEKQQTDVLCEGLAVLKPLIPIKTLALITGVEEAAIRSFAVDLGRPLVVTDASIQFRDEPAETWFRDKFKPDVSRLQLFINKLKPHASRDPYIASNLPTLMLEAGQFDELVALALGSEGLPEDNPIEKRDIELQRLQFALKASLRAGRHVDAAKLALKSGGETAGNTRQVTLLKENTDLVSAFAGPNSILEISARNKLDGKWMGSHHVYEAGLLSGHPELKGEALSRLRMAHDWLRYWSHLPDEHRRKEPVHLQDVAEMAMVNLNLYGPKACAAALKSWRPGALMFEAGRLVARRLIDHARYDELDQIALAAKRNVQLSLAIVLELRDMHRNCPEEVIDHALRVLLRAGAKLKDARWDECDTPAIEVITALVEARLKYSTSDRSALVSLLERYLPKENNYEQLLPRHRRGPFPLLRAHALHAHLSGRSLTWADLVPAEPKEISKNDDYHAQRRRQLEEYFGALWPWYQLWVNVLLGVVTSDGLAKAIDDTKSASSKSSSRGGSMFDQEMNNRELGRIWFDILAESNGPQSGSIEGFKTWAKAPGSAVGRWTLAHFARIAGRRDTMKALCLDYVQQAFESIQRETMDAQEKANGYVMIARSVLPVSKSDAEYYFNEAIKTISKLGDDVIIRWESMLDLADRAAGVDQPQPEMAHRLARCAEMIYPYFARDKHFDWYDTVRAIAGICPTSSIMILSRWRDRNFGYAPRLLPYVVDYLLDKQQIEPRVALCLVGFRSQWDYCRLLKDALARHTAGDEKQLIFDTAWRYMRFTEKDPDIWGEVKGIAVSHRLTCREDIDQIIAYYAIGKQALSSPGHRASEEVKAIDWQAIFSGIDLSSAVDIWTAYQRFKDSTRWYGHELFFNEACKRVSIGYEVQFVAAISKIVKFNLSHLESLMKSLPQQWQGRPAIRLEVERAVKDYCRRDCFSVNRSKYHHWFPFGPLSEAWGIDEGQIVDAVVSGVGEMHTFIEAHHLFKLVGLLAIKLSKDQALDVLSFALELLDKLAERSAGDGPWGPAIYPPAGIDEAMAGYIWAGLAAPSSSLRWEAAHVVRCLCALGQNSVITPLIELAKRGTGEPFVDARLCFYQKHALQWLVLGLARASRENPAVIAPHTDFLLCLALQSEPHVLIREYAAQALLALVAAGQVRLEPPVVDELHSVNASKRPVVESSRFSRRSSDGWNADRALDSHHFGFDYDISRYWFQPLGDCFAIGADAIELEAEAVIRNSWGFSYTEYLNEDARFGLGVYSDRVMLHSHFEYPQNDYLAFYLSYHALMTVAGKLLDTAQLHRDPNEPEDEFHAWLSRHRLVHDDGSWLSDHRDPDPLEWPSWKNNECEQNWTCSVVKRDFERVLGAPNGRINLWGEWTSLSGHREERVRIQSTLVASDRVESLLRALQTVNHPNNYRLPFSDDDTEIREMGFVLKGWVADPYGENDPRDLDPWAGHIPYPRIEPARFVLETMNLHADSCHRVWSMSHESSVETVLWSQLWGSYRDKEIREDQGVERGRRLQASTLFVREFLRTINMSFIIEVQIERNFVGRAHRERYANDEHRYAGPYTRLFAVKPDGRIIAI